jgi:hypothetical protein
MVADSTPSRHAVHPRRTARWTPIVKASGFTTN